MASGNRRHILHRSPAEHVCSATPYSKLQRSTVQQTAFPQHCGMRAAVLAEPSAVSYTHLRAHETSAHL
eukprot:9571151-Alexandrium_andersonii.AAC.1